jgi:hypothetical protein
MELEYKVFLGNSHLASVPAAHLSSEAGRSSEADYGRIISSLYFHGDHL